MDSHPSNNKRWEKTLTSLKARYRALSQFFSTDRGKLIGKFIKYIFQAGIVVFLCYQLSEIGWKDFFTSLPTQPLFYILFLVIFFALPITEIFTYNLSWDISFKEGIPVFLKKRVYNKSVLEYSGEVKLFTWARNKFHASDKEVFKVIRDNNIVSSVASTVVAFGLLLVFLLGDQIALMKYLRNHGNTITILSVAAISVIVSIVIFRFRKYFFSMSRKVALSVFGIHVLRLVFLNIVQVIQWHIVMPDVPLRIWFTFLSLQIILNRIPFLPNKDLLFIGTSLQVSNMIHVSSAGMAGILVTHGVLEKVMNMILYIAISFHEKRKNSESGKTAKADISEQTGPS